MLFLLAMILKKMIMIRYGFNTLIIGHFNIPQVNGYHGLSIAKINNENTKTYRIGFV